MNKILKKIVLVFTLIITVSSLTVYASNNGSLDNKQEQVKDILNILGISDNDINTLENDINNTNNKTEYKIFQQNDKTLTKNNLKQEISNLINDIFILIKNNIGYIIILIILGIIWKINRIRLDKKEIQKKLYSNNEKR